MSSYFEMGPILSHTKASQGNGSQVDSSFEERPPDMITETVDVHAEMDDTVIDHSGAEDADSLPQSPMEKPVTKQLLMATAEQKASYDEMCSIDYDVPWRTIKLDLDRYRKPETPSTSDDDNPITTLMTKPAKVLFSRRNRTSLIDRPLVSETPKRKPQKSSFINAGRSIFDELGGAAINRGRKRKSSDSQEKRARHSSSDSDGNQENSCQQSSPFSSHEFNDSPVKSYSAKKRSPLSTISSQTQVSESSSSLFDLLASGPKYNMGNEIDSSKNPHTSLGTYSDGQSIHFMSESDSSDDNGR